MTEVHRTYDAAKRWSELEGDWPSYLVYRPISLRLTPLALRLGLSANAATTIAAMLALCLPFLAVYGGPLAYAWVAVVAFKIHVLDCLDGNLARANRSASLQGALLDGFVDLCFWALYFVAIGILVDRGPPSPISGHGVTVALAMTTLVLLHRVLRDDYALLFSQRADFTTTPPTHLSFWRLARIAMMGMERAYVVAVLVGGMMGALHVVLMGIAVYVLTIFIAAVATTFAAAKKDGR